MPPEDSLDKLLTEKVIRILVTYPEILLKAQESLIKKMEQGNENKPQQTIQETLRNSPELLSNLKGSVLGEGKKKIFVFLSPYCPHCQHLLKDLLSMVQQSGSDYQFFLLWITHEQDMGGLIAAKALLAASQLGKLQEFSTKLLQRVNRIEEEHALEIAEKIGLNKNVFKEIMESNAIEHQLKSMREAANAISISGYPTLLYAKDKEPGTFEVIEGKPASDKLVDALSK